MPDQNESNSRKLLRRLRDLLAQPGRGQDRLDRITRLIADAMHTEVCSIYLFRDADTLELFATEGLRPEAVHQTRLRLGEGLVGRIARTGQLINTARAPDEKGFRYMPETGEEHFSSFLGVPIQRVDQHLGVLVVQSRVAREFGEDDVYALEIVAMVLAEMAELGALANDGAHGVPLHRQPRLFRGTIAQEGTAIGRAWLHEPRVIVTNPVAEDPAHEIERIRGAVGRLRVTIDDLLSAESLEREQMQVLEAYRMFAHSRGWLRRMEASIMRGLSAEAAVEREQATARARLSLVQDAYLRERMHDLDDLSNRLLRILTGQGQDTGAVPPNDMILIARHIGSTDLLEYGHRLRGVVLDEGSVGSHAAIVARALAIPLVVRTGNITIEALNGDLVIVDGEQGLVHLRPEESVTRVYRERIAMQAEVQKRFASQRALPARAGCGTTIRLQMNAGLIADLPSLEGSGAEGVGLFRTELQFLARNRMPKRAELAALYARVMDAAGGRPVVFRTLDIGSDKVLPYLKPTDEPNPAMGWRAIRVGLDKPGILRMQAQALVRAAAGRPLAIMFPLVATHAEFIAAREFVRREVQREIALGRPAPEVLEIGAMCETPSLVHAPDAFFREADFVSVGGNDLKQFFFAADRQNERVRRRYDTLDLSFLGFLEQVIARCARGETRLSFCGEAAGRPVDAVALAALGFRTLSMRPTSIGPVKMLIRRVNLEEARAVILAAREVGEESARPRLLAWLAALPEVRELPPLIFRGDVLPSGDPTREAAGSAGVRSA